MIERPELEKRRALELMKTQSKVATTAIEQVRERLHTNPRFRNLARVNMLQFLSSARRLTLNTKCCDSSMEYLIE